ncbi:MAG: glycosyltransferase family 4 protein [Paraprevotella sp.]|nr:glycosyltransferase family 4 protein [Paraprevotella sp.]
MKILFITNILPPVVDGVGDYTLNLAKEFARHGHSTCIVCKRDERGKTVYDDIEVFPVIEEWNREAATPVIRLIRERRVDVVSLQYVPHGYDHRGLPFAIAHLARQINRTGVPLYTFFHEVCIGKGKWYQIYRNIVAYLMALIAKQIGDNSTHVGTSIGHYKKRLKALHINNVSLIPIPSNVPVVYTDESYKNYIREAIADKDDTIITLFGNRDFSAVVDAVRLLRDNGSKIKVIALGKANPSIPVEDFIYFTGTLEISRLALYLQITDILILPEDPSSGCSLKSGSLAAALRFGIPTITARGFMTDESLSGLFLFTKENTIEEYTTLIKELMDNGGLRDNLKKGSLDFAERLTWQTVYENYMEALSIPEHI